jgi:hypothetical protein
MKARSWIKVCGWMGWISGAFGTAACAHDPSAAVVVATGPAAAGACPFGGSVVSSGSHANGNGRPTRSRATSRRDSAVNISMADHITAAVRYSGHVGTFRYCQ